jgi:hypothetical protein
MAASVWSNSEGCTNALLGTPKYELLAYDATDMKQKTIASPIIIAFLIRSLLFMVKRFAVKYLLFYISFNEIRVKLDFGPIWAGSETCCAGMEITRHTYLSNCHGNSP